MINGVDTIAAIDYKTRLLQKPSMDKGCYYVLYDRKTHNYQTISDVSGRKVANNTRHCGGPWSSSLLMQRWV